MKAPHEEGSGGCKVIRKGPSPEEQFEVDFAEWETVSEGRKGGSSCGRDSARTARRRERAVRAEAGSRRLDPCACARARAYVRGGGEHFSGREISLWRAGNPLDLIR